MMKQRKNYSADFKAKSRHCRHQRRQNRQRNCFDLQRSSQSGDGLEEAGIGIIPNAFSSRLSRQADEDENLKARLYQEIGQLKVELDWPKKKLGCSVDQKRQLVEANHEQISQRRQCDLIGLPRSS